MTGPDRPDPLELAAEAAAALAERTGAARHDLAVVLGSGWAAVADRLGRPDAVVPVGELPGFAAPTVPGHVAEIRSLDVGGARVLVSLGRVHGYEGYGPAAVAHGVRTAVAAGCRTVVLTNAAGGIADDLAVGQVVLVADHLNLTGTSPLTGGPPGDRFADMTDAYALRLRRIAHDVDPGLREGVYAGVNGPQYETPAEIRMLRTLGADLVGMSTVHETIAAVQLGAEVLAISLVTNLAAGLGGALDHGDVLEVAARATDRVGELLARLVRRLVDA